MSTEPRLPADTFAQEVLSILAQGDLGLVEFAHSIDVHPSWLERVLVGEITELPLLTVVGICRKLRLMPEDIWEPEQAAGAFAGWPGAAFLDGDD